MNNPFKTTNAIQLADIFIKANQDPFNSKPVNWEQVPLFKNNEIHDKYKNYGK